MKQTFAERKFERSNRKGEQTHEYDREVVMYGAMRRRCLVKCTNGRVYVWCAHTKKLLCDLSENGYTMLVNEGYFSE